MIDGVCFPWAYNIISFELTSVIFLFTLLSKSIRLEFSMNCRWAHQPPPHPLFGLKMNYCFGTRSHRSFPENLAMSFCRFVLHLFFSDILSLRYHDTNRIWISVWYDGWDHFPRVMKLILWWSGNMVSCLAPPPPAGGPIIIIPFARITILPGVNCRTYFISCS